MIDRSTEKARAGRTIKASGDDVLQALSRSIPPPSHTENSWTRCPGQASASCFVRSRKTLLGQSSRIPMLLAGKIAHFGGTRSGRMRRHEEGSLHRRKRGNMLSWHRREGPLSCNSPQAAQARPLSADEERFTSSSPSASDRVGWQRLAYLWR